VTAKRAHIACYEFGGVFYIILGQRNKTFGFIIFLRRKLSREWLGTIVVMLAQVVNDFDEIAVLLVKFL